MNHKPSCPVAQTAQIISGKWTLLIIRDIAAGHVRFSEIQHSLRGISPRTLSTRLRRLEDADIIERKSYHAVPPRVEYTLTPKGKALLPIIDDMRVFGSEWLVEGSR